MPHLLRVCVERRSYRRRYRRGSGCFKERIIYRNTIGLDRRERVYLDSIWRELSEVDLLCVRDRPV